MEPIVFCQLGMEGRQEVQALPQRNKDLGFI